ncbi:MAG: hypothetical protein PHS82_08830 [Lachnospiraceae bacterium]|nr:hypothetical protein [Lachnospiraceae bacterium]
MYKEIEDYLLKQKEKLKYGQQTMRDRDKCLRILQDFREILLISEEEHSLWMEVFSGALAKGLNQSGLSTRALTALTMNNIRTYAALREFILYKPKYSLMGMRNIGKETAVDILVKSLELGIVTKEELKEGHGQRNQAMQQCTENAIRTHCADKANQRMSRKNVNAYI